MNQLNELLNSLCPDGVEYKKLRDVADVERGKRVVRKELAISGDIPVFQNSLIPLGYCRDSNVTKDTPFVIGAGAAGEVGYSNCDFWAADDCYPLICHESLDPRYCYHFLLSSKTFIRSRVRKASIPRLSRSVIERLEIPVPPIEIQQEIVRILDSFAELEAELEARRKQYAYYRDKLLAFPEKKES